jgi:hypothetical protein
MIGQRPNCKIFQEMFSWPDSVIEIEPDGSDILEALAALKRDPERRSAISRRNAAEALQHHDWVHRWKEIYRVAGLEPSPAFAAREGRLKSLANTALCESLEPRLSSS